MLPIIRIILFDGGAVMTIAHVDCSIEAFYEAIEEEFQKVESDPNSPCKHFVYQGIRYVRCDKCREIWKTSDCVYYGGEGKRMFCGGCRNCYGQGVKE